MMNIRHRWNGIGVPTQSHPNAASLTLSAWNTPKLMFEDPLSSAAILSPWQLSGKQGVLPDIYDIKCIPEAAISWTNVELLDHIKVVYRTVCWNMFCVSMVISSVHVLPSFMNFWSPSSVYVNFCLKFYVSSLYYISFIEATAFLFKITGVQFFCFQIYWYWIVNISLSKHEIDNFIISFNQL